MDKNSSFNIIAKQNTGEVFQASAKGSVHSKNDLHASFQTGQQIIGRVVEKKEYVTLDFQGKQVNVSPTMFPEVQLGDSKTFIVLKVTEQLIELKEVQEDHQEKVQEEKKATSSIRIDKDQEAYQVKKKYSNQSMVEDQVIHGILGKMSDVLAKMTELDVMNLGKEGLSMDHMDVEQLYHAMNRMKEKNNTDSSPKDFIEDNHESEIEKRLKDANIPVTKEAFQNIQTAMTLSEMVPQINENTSHYLISNQMKPTIENIYKAYYNGNANEYKASNPLTEDAWAQLKPQTTQVILEAGYEVNDKSLSEGKWLIEGQLPLTKENLVYKKELDEIKMKWDKDTTLDNVIAGMKDGIAPKDVSLATQSAGSYDDMMEKINHIKDSTIKQAVQKDNPITIEELDRLQKQQEDSQQTSSIIEEEQRTEKDTSYEAVKAQRQLEEIRLKMTKEAAATLEKKGFHIETEPLEKVVEELKILENQYYQRMCEEGHIEPTDENINRLSQTHQQLNLLKELPSYLLGRTLEDRLGQTIPSLVEAGTKLQGELLRAGEAYETLMTVPSREYGDSIQKAFSNMDSLLQEMKIENTAANQRAVRILAYNQMEINQENIDRMKLYDTQVNDLMKNLNPGVTLQLLKDGINPLDTPITELNQQIEELKQEKGISTEEKYSVYLQKLDKAHGISENERKAYIGIYRLLYNVEKSDGAALGALVKSEREITLNHLLSAVNTIKNPSVNSIVDDDFGLLESVTRTKDTISEQIEAAFTNETEEKQVQKEEQKEVRRELYQKLLKDLIEEISPEKLRAMEQSMGSEHAISNIEGMPQILQQQNIWNGIKDKPLDFLLEQMQQIQVENQMDEEIAKTTLSQLREIYMNGDQSIKFLNLFKLPHTPVNLQMANQLLSNGSIERKKVLKENEDADQTSEIPLKEMTNLADNLIDKSSMNEAYDNLVDLAKDTLELACSNETLSSVKLAQLRMIGAQMTFLKSLAQKEYYQIPVETEQGIVHMNLTIIRGTEEAGKVSISVQSEQMGLMRADLTLQEGMLGGFIFCEGRKELEELKLVFPQIEKTLSEEGINVKQINFTLSRREIENLNSSSKEQESHSKTIQNNTEKDLYKIAKAFVKGVQQVHKN